MHDTGEWNARSPSTTWAWRRVKIGRPPEASSNSGSKSLHSTQLARRDTRKPLSITIVHRGGAEDWWELRARGRIVRRPGWVALTDVLREFD
jgi:hypothetical protein